MPFNYSKLSGSDLAAASFISTIVAITVAGISLLILPWYLEFLRATLVVIGIFIVTGALSTGIILTIASYEQKTKLTAEKRTTTNQIEENLPNPASNQ